MESRRWLRGFAIFCLILFVHCKMVDLDCACSEPLHCQTLLESNDNDFGYVELIDLPLFQPLAVTLKTRLEIPRPNWPSLAAEVLPPDQARWFIRSDGAKRPPPRLT